MLERLLDSVLQEEEQKTPLKLPQPEEYEYVLHSKYIPYTTYLT